MCPFPHGHNHITYPLISLTLLKLCWGIAWKVSLAKFFLHPSHSQDPHKLYSFRFTWSIFYRPFWVWYGHAGNLYSGN